MVRVAAAGILLLVIATPAFAQPDGFQRQLKAQLESVRPPIFVNGARITGAAASYAVSGSGCQTAIVIQTPQYSLGGTPRPGSTQRITLNWESVNEVRPAGDYVLVFARGIPSAGLSLYAGNAAGSARMKTVMDNLAGACRGAAAHTAPVNVAPISQRVPEKPDVLGTPRCHFRMIPELLLTDNKPPVVKSAVFRVPAREGGGDKTQFSVGAQPGAVVSSWEGILANPRITLDSPIHLDAQVTRAEIRVDNAPIAIPVAPRHPANAYPSVIPGRFYSTVSVDPTQYNPGGLLAAIARGNTMVVSLYAGSRQVSAWTFDVSRLRHIPAALKGARWTCK